MAVLISACGTRHMETYFSLNAIMLPAASVTRMPSVVDSSVARIIASDLASNEDVKEFYLGVGGGERKSFKDVKSYKRRKRWLA